MALVHSEVYDDDDDDDDAVIWSLQSVRLSIYPKTVLTWGRMRVLSMARGRVRWSRLSDLEWFVTKNGKTISFYRTWMVVRSGTENPPASS